MSKTGALAISDEENKVLLSVKGRAKILVLSVCLITTEVELLPRQVPAFTIRSGRIVFSAKTLSAVAGIIASIIKYAKHCLFIFSLLRGSCFAKRHYCCRELPTLLVEAVAPPKAPKGPPVCTRKVSRGKPGASELRLRLELVSVFL